VIVGVLVVVWLVAVVRWQPHDASPASSVEHQHRALQALHEAATRARGGPEPAAETSDAGWARPPELPRGAVPDGATLLPVPVGVEPTTPRRRGFRRPLTAAALAVGLAGAGVAVNAVATRPPSSPGASEPAVGTGPATAGRDRPGAEAPAPPPTVPTTAARAATRVVSSDARNTLVSVVAGPDTRYGLTVRAAGGRCWIQVDATSGGTAAAGSILEPGQTMTLDLSGPASVRLGNAAVVSFAVDGQPIPLPGLPAGAYQVDLRPEAPA